MVVEHLPEHQHAFIKNGVVVWVGVFEGHNVESLELLKPMFDADTVICCCNVGIIPSVDWTWDGISFIRPPESPEYLAWLESQK